MIDVSEHLIWALILFAVTTGPDGRETVTNSAPTYHETRADCQAEGDTLMSLVATGDGMTIDFACVPRAVLNEPAPR